MMLMMTILMTTMMIEWSTASRSAAHGLCLPLNHGGWKCMPYYCGISCATANVFSDLAVRSEQSVHKKCCATVVVR